MRRYTSMGSCGAKKRIVHRLADERSQIARGAQRRMVHHKKINKFKKRADET